MPLIPAGPRRPGMATASAVLQFVQSGFVMAGAFWLLFAGSVAETFGWRGLSHESTALGVLGLLASGLLIAGGVTVLAGKVGLTVLSCVLSLGISVYFVIRIAGPYFGAAVWLPVAYAILPLLALIMGCTGDVRRWGLERRSV